MKASQLRALREVRALTQEELAAKAGVARGTVNRLEQGHDAYPPTIRKLAEALGVEPAELMREMASGIFGSAPKGTIRRQPDGTTPQDWLTIADRDCEDADQALAGGRWEAAGFFAIQAIEKALKALARKHTTYGDLNGRPYSHLEGLAYEQIESGGDQANLHHLVRLVELLRPWHQDIFDRFRPDLDWIDNDNLYERLRYPNPAPSQGTGQLAAVMFGEVEARRLRALADEVLSVVRSRL